MERDSERRRERQEEKREERQRERENERKREREKERKREREKERRREREKERKVNDRRVRYILKKKNQREIEVRGNHTERARDTEIEIEKSIFLNFRGLRDSSKQ